VSEAVETVNEGVETDRPFTIQVEIWGKLFTGDTMHRLGTLDYYMKDGKIIGATTIDFQNTVTEFMGEVEEAFNSVG
jgi:hypothetical protein